jgi:transposase
MDGGSHKPNSMPNSFSRIEVITGVGRRRSWTAEQKARIVAESCLPSTTVSAVARRYAINTNQLFEWRRELGANRARFDVEPEPSFVPLIVDSRPDSEIDVAERPPISPPTIEVVAGRLSIRVPNGVDEATLRQVLGVVRDFA